MWGAIVCLILFLAPGATAAAPKKIVTLNPSLTETLFELGLGSSIVGTVDASDFPEAAKKIERIGSYGRPNVEKIIKLKPDVVLTFKEGIDRITPTLKRANIRLLIFESRSAKDYPEMVKTLGQEFGLIAKAEEHLKKWHAEWQVPPAKNANGKVLLQLEGTPLIVAGGDSFLTEILNRCGFSNAFGDHKGYPTISKEAVSAKKVDFIAVLMENVTDQTRESIQKNWASSPLTRNISVVFYDSHRLSRLGPGLPGEARKFCQALKEAR